MNKFLGFLSLIWKLYIGVIFLITALFYYPFITAFLFKEEHKKTAFKLFVAWSWTVRILCFYHVRKINKKEIPTGPFIVVANHISYFDIFFMYSILPKNRFLFLGKSEILKYPLIKTYFKRLNIPVYRGDRRKSAMAVVKSKEEIAKGWSLIIFPEGGIPDDNNPKMIRFKDGAFTLAKNMNVPIVPLTFLNNHILFSDPTKILGFARPGICYVQFHDVITKEEVAEMSTKELRQHCFNVIEKPLLERYPKLRE